MARRAADGSLLPLALDPAATEPLYRQLYDQLRRLILSGRLAAGARLPSSRTLAHDLGLSRTTVVTAFEQLLAEGYAEAAVGAGTRVAHDLPEAASRAVAADLAPAGNPRRRGLSRRGTELAHLMPRRGLRRRSAFAIGLPDTDSFPFDVWARLLARAWRRPDPDLTAAGDSAGYPPLRRAIAEHLRTARGVACDADQVIVVAGAQQGIDLAARILLDPGDAVWVEEPGYPGLRTAMVGAGARLVPVPVDEEGIDVAAGERLRADTRLACVTPSHHHPLGATMSLRRRLALLDWASRRDAWILEDDYDSEYRYAGRPLAALAGLDRAGRVVYVGTFSKVLFPSIRLGYLVVPADLVEPFRRVRGALDDHAASALQPVLARFIEDGHFAAHVRRMRRLYQARQQALLDAAARHLDGLLTLAPDAAGLHLVAGFGPLLAGRMDDRTAAARAEAAGISVQALSAYYWQAPAAQGLLLGYAAVPEDEIDRAAAKLARALAG